MSNPEDSRSHGPELSKGFSANDPPEIIRPTLPSDLRGFSTVDELIDRLTGDERSAFPYEQELTLYVLLVASLWPNDHERLLAAARIFSGALNFHFSRWRQTKEWLLDPSGAYVPDDSRKEEINSSREKEINSFNEKFFINIGGLKSLLFSPSVEDFHRDVRKRVEDLAVLHDFAEYLFKSSMLSKKISSATFAYHAIAYNIFCREGGYGTQGPKRKEKAKREGTTRVIEVDTVRTRCRKAPDTVILSYIMTRWFGIHLFDPANPKFFQDVSAHQVSSSGLRIAISIIRDRLLRNRSRLNTATMKWARVNASPLLKPAYLYTLTAEELERAFKISDVVRDKPISQKEKDAARQRLGNPRGLFSGKSRSGEGIAAEGDRTHRALDDIGIGLEGTAAKGGSSTTGEGA